MIDERVVKWKELVPVPLAQVAARSLCEQDQPCDDCLEETVAILAHVYAYNAYASVEAPCLACSMTRGRKADLAESCVFHEGVDQGFLHGLSKPIGQARVTVRPSWHRRLRQWLLYNEWGNFVICLIVAVCFVAVVVTLGAVIGI